MGKKSPQKAAKDKAWKLFSTYIRRRDSINGYCTCITCGKHGPYKSFQAGHFIPGRNNSILFEEDAVHSQCVGCNMYGGGKPAKYYEYMKRRYGVKRIDELYTIANKPKKMTIGDYMDLIDEINDKLVGLDMRGN